MANTTKQNVVDDDFKQNIIKARVAVSAELTKHGYDIDVRMLTTISVMTTAALKYYKEEITSKEARESFDKAIAMYQNSSVPF